MIIGASSADIWWFLTIRSPDQIIDCGTDREVTFRLVVVTPYFFVQHSQWARIWLGTCLISRPTTTRGKQVEWRVRHQVRIAIPPYLIVAAEGSADIQRPSHAEMDASRRKERSAR